MLSRSSIVLRHILVSETCLNPFCNRHNIILKYCMVQEKKQCLSPWITWLSRVIGKTCFLQLPCFSMHIVNHNYIPQYTHFCAVPVSHNTVLYKIHIVLSILLFHYCKLKSPCTPWEVCACNHLLKPFVPSLSYESHIQVPRFDPRVGYYLWFISTH